MASTEAPIGLAELADMAVTRLAGVGEKRAAALAEVGIGSVLDLLMYYPRRYIDRTNEATVADLAAAVARTGDGESDTGAEGMVLATVEKVSARRTRNRRSLVTVRVADATGRIECVFFNQPWRQRQLAEGSQVIVYGKATTYRGALQMSNPIVDLVGDQTGRIVPVYPQSEKAGLTTGDVGRWVAEILRRCEPRGLADPVPASLLGRHGLVGRGTALRAIHQPETMGECQSARRRLVYDELLRIQLSLVRAKRELEATTEGIVHDVTGPVLGGFLGGLPWDLTGAQQRVIDEVMADLASPVPMHRLLQGDVGAGKTLVAVAALVAAVDGGHQGAFMAPTEVLAEQHHGSVTELLRGATVPANEGLFAERELRVELLTNRITGSSRTRVLEGLESGEVDIVVGTHALLSENVGFASLGAVVVDEQHRFGVEQRAALRGKRTDSVADVLVMTATPIPRTAAMTVYGDLDVSVLDELPPGRTPVRTEWLVPDAEGEAWEAVRREVAAGRQAYVVCPLVETSEKLEVASATETWERLREGELSDLTLGLLHGRVSSGEKEKVMTLFRDGAVDVLVATTVIEVGVDVPNATVMVVLGADRFGIAQLHQLRGRVGRGAEESRCFLVAEAVTEEAEERLAALVASTDGFELAEVDLDLRGEGTVMGERQKGRSDLRLASLRRDREWVARARSDAIELLDTDPGLAANLELASELDALLGSVETDYLMKS
ncbi:MAG: ATP-dependent DNA helicase RecG [Acidimicrobiales bacterium]